MNVSNKRKLLIVVLTYLAYVSIYVGWVNLTQTAPVLETRNIITKAQIGLLGSIFFGIYAFGRLLNGSLSDRVSPYIMIGAGLTLSAIGKAATLNGLMDFTTYGGASVASFAYGFSIESFGYNFMYISWIVICVLSVLILSKLAYKKA